jgi:hypothetical protein
MPDPEEIPENILALLAGNSYPDTGGRHFYRNTRRTKLGGKTIYQKILPGITD